MEHLLRHKVELTYDWLDPITKIKGVGTAVAEKLAKLDIFTMGDLILHFPYRYQDRTRLMPIRHAPLGEDVLVQGTIIGYQEKKQKRKQLIVTIEDGTGVLQLVFFHYYANMLQQFKPGGLLRCFGETKFYQMKGMVHPEFQIVTEETPLEPSLTPVYPTISGVSQNWWRKTIGMLLSTMTPSFLGKNQTWEVQLASLFGYDLLSACQKIHFPEPDCQKAMLLERKDKAYQRVIFEELIAHKLSLSQIRNTHQQYEAIPLTVPTEALVQAKSKLPFLLTDGQEQVLQDIQGDLSKKKPMLRLVQGDVGSGKTVVAILSAFVAVQNQVQVAIMAPTEVLADQLYQQFNLFFSQYSVNVACLTGKLKDKQKRIIGEQLQQHQIHIIVGTHALFQESVQYAKLGLVVIDEQHRFGVHQRLSLNAKGMMDTEHRAPHQLIMTATPIPRTLCMSYYTHLDNSQLLMLPKGRKAIQTVVVSNEKREQIIQRIHQHCRSKEQVYWVCALVEETENLEAQAAKDTFSLLSQLLPGISVGLVHGKLSSLEKESVMSAFYKGDIQLLVATTVIEVGVNVPNATLMVIENAERFGLSQLHQLRGRVGRGEQQSYCVLLYQPPLSRFASERLDTMRQTTDGFEIAEKDLALRGPGEVLGLRQSGAQMLKVADFARDYKLIHKVNAFLSDYLLDPIEQHTLIERWFKRQSGYAQV